MIKFIACILFASLFLCSQVHAFDTPELHDIKEKEPTSKIYERAVVFFTQKIPETFKERLNNSHKYIDMVTGIFDEKGIPFEIAYLPLIESGFSPLSVGPGGTTGLWQFVRGTALKYGLKIDNYVDERRDPVKSTLAAAAYLRDLYSLFGAWDIALAAYNAGEGRIKNIHNIYTSKRTPAITKRYIPYLMAAYTVAQDPESYGFDPEDDIRNESIKYNEITTLQVVSLKTIAQRHNTTVKELRSLNPALLTDHTPPYRYTIKVPEI
ncbi:MAG: lytic transglycosylase domain-containing protein [Dissulfurispiraceae bacterium]